MTGRFRGRGWPRHGRCRVRRAEGHLEQHERPDPRVAHLQPLARIERLQVRNAGVRSLGLLQVTLGAERTATLVAGPPPTS